MRRLTDKKDIAQAINFGKYPVIYIDMSDKDDYGIKGTKVNIDFGGDYYVRGTIRAYNDEKVLTTTSGVVCISNSFSYDDYLEMVEYANAPVIKANQEIVICMFESANKVGHAPMIIKTGKRVDRFCMTPLTLEKVKLNF